MQARQGKLIFPVNKEELEKLINSIPVNVPIVLRSINCNNEGENDFFEITLDQNLSLEKVIKMFEETKKQYVNNLGDGQLKTNELMEQMERLKKEAERMKGEANV